MCYLFLIWFRLRTGLHRGDRAMIYVFIASSYFPWLSLMQDTVATVEANLASWFSDGSHETDCWIDLKWTIWCLAAAGILYQQMFYERYKWLETVIYVLISVLPAIPFILEVGFSFRYWLRLILIRFSMIPNFQNCNRILRFLEWSLQHYLGSCRNFENIP